MRYAEYVQRLDMLKVPLEGLQSLLEARPLKRWAFIVHDKDGTEPHLHLAMEFKSEQSPANIAKWFNDAPERIEYAKQKQYPFENMLSYQYHLTPSADGKHKYDPSEGKANFNIKETLDQIAHDVEKSKTRSGKYPIDDKLQAILDGTITRYRIDEHIDGLAQIKYKRQIDNAFEIADRRKAKEIDRQMDVMYLCGNAGTGKTTLAKWFAKQKGYDCFVSGSSNDPLQGYLGQECIVLDDIRGSDWKLNDLLKILDNNTASLAKSRYSNKLLKDCKMMILTSVQSLDDLYSGIKQSDDTEPIEQLMRRVQSYAVVEKNTLHLYSYNPETRGYVFEADVVNPVPMMTFAKANRSIISDLMKAVDEFPLEDSAAECASPRQPE